VFSLGSLLCGLAPSLAALIAARALQAIGGSMLNPVAMSIIRNTFEDDRKRAQAIGIWGAVFGLSMALGPVVGGALVASSSWRAVFFVNVPIGLLAIALTALYVPESRAGRARRLDPVGQLLVIAGLAPARGAAARDALLPRRPILRRERDRRDDVRRDRRLLVLKGGVAQQRAALAGRAGSRHVRVAPEPQRARNRPGR
jgi:MFS family permease